MKNRVLPSVIFASTIIFQACLAQGAGTIDSIEFSDPLDTVVMENGTVIHFDVGIGSGACRLKSDPEGQFYTITDRGPNIKTSDAHEMLGYDYSAKRGKIFPTPNFAPTVYSLKLLDGKLSVLSKIQIKTSEGIPISGISNPGTEAAWNINGQPLKYDPAGIDAEGIVKLSDGSFWIAEEYGPSILHLAADGRVIERWVPEGIAPTLKGCGYTVKEKLPAILRLRPLNRGIESITASPDEKYLYFAMQSPLANPDKSAYKKSRKLRIFKIDRQAEEVVGEYVYLLDKPDSFYGDNEKKPRKQHDVKISEMTAVDTDRLVVLERISKTTKFYQVNVNSGTNILRSKWDAVTTVPSLEQQSNLEAKTVTKKLLLDSDQMGGLMKKVEGLAWLGDDTWIMVNDNDFGIEGDATFVKRVVMPVN